MIVMNGRAQVQDADLLGIPFRVTIGTRLEDGMIEIRHRRDGLTVELMPEQAVEYLLLQISSSDSAMLEHR